jgi:hypothetical protein
MRIRPNNPLTYGDIRRCPWSYHDGWRYVAWNRLENLRLEKIQKSWLRFIKRLFAKGAWHPRHMKYCQYPPCVLNEDLFL